MLKGTNIKLHAREMQIYNYYKKKELKKKYSFYIYSSSHNEVKVQHEVIDNLMFQRRREYSLVKN